MQTDHRSPIRSEINVTPLVDVCLVLLIIFMVVTPILTNGPPVDLPLTAHPDKKPQTTAQFPIALLFERPPQIIFGTNFRHLSPEEFQIASDELYQRSPNSELVLRADRRLSYGDVRAVLLVLRKAGFRNVSLISQPEAGPQPIR